MTSGWFLSSLTTASECPWLALTDLAACEAGRCGRAPQQLVLVLASASAGSCSSLQALRLLSSMLAASAANGTACALTVFFGCLLRLRACSKDQDPLQLLQLWSEGPDGHITRQQGRWHPEDKQRSFITRRVSQKAGSCTDCWRVWL